MLCDSCLIVCENLCFELIYWSLATGPVAGHVSVKSFWQNANKTQCSAMHRPLPWPSLLPIWSPTSEIPPSSALLQQPPVWSSAWPRVQFSILPSATWLGRIPENFSSWCNHITSFDCVGNAKVCQILQKYVVDGFAPRYCGQNSKAHPWEGGKAGESGWSFLSSGSQVKTHTYLILAPVLLHHPYLLLLQGRGLSEMYTGQERDGWPRVFTVQVEHNKGTI